MPFCENGMSVEEYLELTLDCSGERSEHVDTPAFELLSIGKEKKLAISSLSISIGRHLNSSAN